MIYNRYTLLFGLIVSIVFILINDQTFYLVVSLADNIYDSLPHSTKIYSDCYLITISEYSQRLICN